MLPAAKLKFEMPFIDNVCEFQLEREKQNCYFERLDSFFTSNKIDQVATDAAQATVEAVNNEKVDALISMIGTKGLWYSTSFYKPDKPNAKA